MYMSVGQVARTLGVTPHTVRRWTSSGFLPCERTAGGHRRIASGDVDELRRAIGSSGHLQARRAREREVDTLAQASIDLAAMLDGRELLAAIARHVTRLCDCSTCAISHCDFRAGTITMLAEYDATGRRMPDIADYHLADFPLTRRVLERGTPVVVNIDDRGADAAEVALLRRYGDRSVLMVPLVFQDVTMGLLEALDSSRPRRYSPQELRLVQALAGNAAVAMRNAELYRAALGAGDPADLLTGRLRRLAELLTEPGRPFAPDVSPDRVARLVCDVFGAHSCVVARRGAVVGAALGPPSGPQGRSTPGRDVMDGVADAAASVLCSDALGDIEISVTLLRPAAAGDAALLDVLAALATGSSAARDA